MSVSERVAVIGLGYVGLPVACAFADKLGSAIGYDIDATKVAALQAGVDTSGAVDAATLAVEGLVVSADEAILDDATCFIVTVPTPIDAYHRPDLSAVIAATRAVGRHLKSGDLVVYESTVYPGVTEDICGPLLAELSGLKRGRDFYLGYSPERINPGDPGHTFENVTKIVAGEDGRSLARVAALYRVVVGPGVYEAESIKVAEAAKLIENTQRDINIALMNELAVICDKLSIRTRDVLAAAGTKWNFLPFKPGLVGGHCIGVDPYYLAAVAEELDYHPEMLLAGRRINDSMGRYVAQRTVKLLIQANIKVHGARVAVLGLTFKENFPDLRNSRVPDIIGELAEFGIESLVHDPLADPAAATAEYGVHLVPWERLRDLDAIVLAVAHAPLAAMSVDELLAGLRPGGVLVDVKSAVNEDEVPDTVTYWCL